MSQACYSHPTCNLNLLRLFRFSLSLPNFNLFQNILPMIWLSLVEINVEKTAAWEETALVSEYL